MAEFAIPGSQCAEIKGGTLNRFCLGETKNLSVNSNSLSPADHGYASEHPHPFLGIASVVNLWHERTEWSFSASSPEQD